MNSPSFNRPTTVWVAMVLASGLATAADMFRGYEDPTARDLGLIAIFGGLGIFWTLLTFKAGRFRGGRAAISLAPAAYLALLTVAQPAVLVTTSVLVLLVDWIVHRRHTFAGLFNLGQTIVSLWCAVHASRLLTAAVPGLGGAAAGTLLGGLVYAGVNILLVQIVFRLAVGRRAGVSGVGSFAAITNEVVVACFAAIMGVCWMVSNPLLALPVVPQTLLFLTLSRLEQRETSLKARQSELQSLQELGLQVSAQLDRASLGTVVTRIVAEDLRATGALVAFLSEDQMWLDIAAISDRRDGPMDLARMRRAGLSDEFLADGNVLVGTPEDMSRYPELETLSVSSFVAHPLSILGRPEAVIIAFDFGARDPFTAEDGERLASLTKFIEVALNNARLYDDVKSMQQQLVQSEKMSALGQLVSGVAHELNNPLGTIVGSAELLAETGLGEPQLRALERIRREAERAGRIVRNLLTFGRHHKPDFDWNSLNDVVREVVEMREYECRTRNIEVRAEFDERVPLIRMDSHQIHQVLLNLVTNAIHAVEVRPHGASIIVRTLRDGRRVRVEVIDNGHGIEENRLDRIFNPFFTTKPIGKGTGLGLSICYGIVQEHGGAIRVRSVPGRGATFTVELPIPPEPAPATAPRSPARPARALPERMSGRVLIVDDEAGIRSVLSEALATWGFAVLEASTGERGLELLREGGLRLAILDLRMPGLDGRALFDQAVAEGFELPPVLFSTGDAASKEAREFLERTDAPVLLKPFTLLSLREKIDEMLAEEPRPVEA